MTRGETIAVLKTAYEALKPFEKAANEVLEHIAERRRLGMSPPHEDASAGFGLTIQNIVDARIALAVVRAALPTSDESKP